MPDLRSQTWAFSLAMLGFLGRRALGAEVGVAKHSEVIPKLGASLDLATAIFAIHIKKKDQKHFIFL